MKNKRSSILAGMLGIALLQLAVNSSHAQIIATNGNTVIINNFDTSDQVLYNNNLNPSGNYYPWQWWFGTALSNIVWDASDASNNPSSGSLLIQAYFPQGSNALYNSGSSQFLVMNGFGAFTPGFAGNGNTTSGASLVTNFSADIRFAPFDATNASGNFPDVEFGTRGNTTDYQQLDFGSITVPGTNTNWVHVSFPVAQNANWTNIGMIYVAIKQNGSTTGLGSTTNNVPEWLYVDNLEFQLGIPSNAPPVLAVQKSTPALRIFANGGQYARTQIATIDTNQSWVGGSYPVSYSFTISGYSTRIAVNEFHVFWIPLNFNSGTLDQFSDYSTASNTFRLQITQGSAGGAGGGVQLAWKTNVVNSNPTQIVLSTNVSTIVGTWTLTFSNATSGALIPPGGSPEPFTINDPNIATDFGNPMVYELGIQPDPTASIGSYVDVTHVQTVGVASPGVPVNSDFTTGTIDTNIWLTGQVSANGSALVPVNPANAPYWVSWTTPDLGFGLGTKADLTSTNAWKTPNYYAGYPTNGLTVPVTYDFGGAYKWELIPAAGLPTVDGTTNGVKSANAFFLMQNPSPAQ